MQDRKHDQETICAIITAQSDAWARGDAKAWAKPFAEDVDFVVRDGSYVKGRETVERDHARFFRTFYEKTKHRGRISAIRFVTNDAAVVHIEVNVARKEDEFLTTPQFRAVCVFAKTPTHDWKIVSFQNTMVQTPL